MRTHGCGALRASHAGETVELAGWVHRRRDHGGVIFLDLRDRDGLTQITLHPDDQPEAYSVAEKLRSEYVVTIQGEVRLRPAGSENANLATGEIEVVATAIDILAESETPPFLIEDGIDASEELRIRYRFLDLRRPEMLEMLRLRHQVVRSMRDFFDEQGFLEIETPIITKATPEGARDFLVPSRLDPGNFWALPQSPQLFKQLLMIAGVDRYYQIARCLRDEDPRKDRQFEFTQLDMEMSFVEQATIIDMTERMFVRIFRDAFGIDLPTPFPSMTYEESIKRFGSDKPDLRYELELVDLTNVFAGTQIRIFQSVLGSGGVATALLVEGQAGMARKDLDALALVARNLGAGGLAWVGYKKEGISSPLSSVLSEAEIAGVREGLGAKVGDLALIVCDADPTAYLAMGAVREEVANRLGLIPELVAEDPQAWKFLWVLDPPLLEWKEDEKRWDAVHHPFTAPYPQDEVLLDSDDPGAARAQAYDIVLNGWEVGGGSIRIHRPELQRRVFELIGIDDETAKRRFGWFLKAFDYGAPPHGGIAPGVDRIVAKMLGLDHIRGVIAFPKTGAYTDPMTGAPDPVDSATLKELLLKTTE
jgi:aspartyl-tRNA synthetase